MLSLRSLLIAFSAAMVLIPSASAETLRLTPEDERAHKAETDLWLDTIFGHCLFTVSGETWAEHPADLRGEWSDLRPDYASTLLEPLHDPKVSAAPSAVILDLNEAATSCWTQLSSVMPEHAANEFGRVGEALAAEDRIKTAYVDQGYGSQQVGVILVGKDRTPVILYTATNSRGPLVSFITIVQKTEPGFVYYD